jgi:hypothetical protein
MSPETVFVIIRQTGEYDSYYETAIRFVLTKDEAKAAIALATEEGKAKKQPPYPACESQYGTLMPDGSWLEGWHPGHPGAWTLKPNAADLKMIEDTAIEIWRANCRAMGCVDPEGPDPDASYVYEEVSRLP